jgi:hypothetical protein
MHLKAIKSLPYGGKRYNPGETFEASDKHGKLLVAIGKAKECAAPKVETPAEEKPKRVYQRKDMQSQD